MKMPRWILSGLFLSLAPCQGELLPFERLGPPPSISQYGTVAIDPSDGNRFYFATRGESASGKAKNAGLYVSTDGGSQWKHHPKVNPSVNYGNVGVKVHPSHPEIVVAVCEYQPNFWISLDRGATWQGTKAPYKHGISIALDPLDPQVIYVGSDDGVWKTTDQGGSWKSLRQGLPALTKAVSNTATDLLIDPNHPDTIYVGFLYAALDDPWGIYKSTDGGQNWKARNQGLPTDALEIDLSQAQLTKADGSPSKAKMRSPMILKLQHRAIECLAMDSTNPQILYANTREKGLFRTLDGGEHWTRIAPARFKQEHSEVGAKVMGLLVHPEDPKVLIAGTDRLSLFASKDQGENWTYAGRIYDVEQANRQTVFVLPNGDRVPAKNLDNVKKGVSWRLFTPQVDPDNPDSLLVSSDLGLFRVQLADFLKPE